MSNPGTNPVEDDGSSSSTPVPNEQPTENPLASSFAFDLQVPPIEVKMVHAVALTDYEVWFFVASLAFTAAVAFGVAYQQSKHVVNGHQMSNGSYAVDAVIFGVLFVAFLARASVIRRLMRRSYRTYRMTASAEVKRDATGR